MIQDFLVRNYNFYYNIRLQRKLGEQAMDLPFWKKRKASLARFSGKPDVLMPSYRALKSKGIGLSTHPLQAMFQDLVLGAWTLDRNTIRFLWHILQQTRPKRILECGAGVSTLLFSKYLQLYAPDGKVLSIEQDLQEKSRVENILKQWGLENFSRIIHVPVDQQGAYLLQDADELNSLEEKIELMMIDGPAGPDECRRNTLPYLSRWAVTGCRWFMDDGFRDDAMAIIEDWGRKPNITVTGIYPIGKGLVTGSIIQS